MLLRNLSVVNVVAHRGILSHEVAKPKAVELRFYVTEFQQSYPRITIVALQEIW